MENATPGKNKEAILAARMAELGIDEALIEEKFVQGFGPGGQKEDERGDRNGGEREGQRSDADGKTEGGGAEPDVREPVAHHRFVSEDQKNTEQCRRGGNERSGGHGTDKFRDLKKKLDVHVFVFFSFFISFFIFADSYP